MGVVRRAPALREGHAEVARHHRLVEVFLQQLTQGHIDPDLREVGADVVLQHEQVGLSLEHDEVDRELAARSHRLLEANQRCAAKRGRGCRQCEAGRGSSSHRHGGGSRRQGIKDRWLARGRWMAGKRGGAVRLAVRGGAVWHHTRSICFIFCGRIVRAACAPHRGTDVHDRDRQTRRHLRMAECKRLRAPHRIA